MQTKIATLMQSNYDLKRNEEALFEKKVSSVTMSLNELELIRTSKEGITASKYGLESICGVSCETGAQ